MLSKEIKEFIKDKLAIVSDDHIRETPLTEGRSGAEVYRIKVESRKKRFSGCHIVKLFDAGESREETESEKARNFRDAAPGFADYLVKVEAEGTVGGKDVLIYSQANHRVRDTVAFAGLDGELLGRYTRQVSCDLLDLLNEDFWTGGSLDDFFNCLVGRQLGPGGRFTPRMEALLEEPDAPCVALNGVIYPNPLYFMRHTDEWSSYMEDQIFFRGAVHGDLHGDNLLASDNTYSVIDYDSAATDSYLLFDHAYFELSIDYDNSRDNDLKRWGTMVEHLVTLSLTQTVEPGPCYKEYQVRNGVCNGILDWMKKHRQENLVEDLELQLMLARIAAGINFFSKKSCADRPRQLKILLYMACCFRLLLDRLGVPYDTSHVSSLMGAEEAAETEELWEGFVKYTSYIPVLITDDSCLAGEREHLGALCALDWSLVVDIGLEQNDPVVFRLLLEHCRKRTVKRVTPAAEEKADTFRSTLNLLAIRKPQATSYRSLWRDWGKQVLDTVRKLCGENPKVPLVFVFDCGRDSLPFRNQLLNRLCESECGLPPGTRFVSLRSGFSREFGEEIPELEEEHKWHFLAYPGSGLAHIARTCQEYLNESGSQGRCANLPAINGICCFQEADLVSFESSIELVYSGCEYDAGADTVHTGINMSGGGDSLGEAFYKGNEVTWRDLSADRDLPLYTRENYQKALERLVRLAEEKSPRVKTTTLFHGAGSGGTTLSKRILWDLKDQLPCARLKHYSARTADILLEIYQKTGKCVLLSVESGSTVISEDDLAALRQKMDGGNGRLLILLVKRTDTSSSENQEVTGKHILPPLGDTMPNSIARNFRTTFQGYAEQKQDAADRKKWLTRITADDHYKEQRSPFFYGFYTFQEEYHLVSSLVRTVSGCREQEKNLLNSLAIVTTFSQNIVVNVQEMLLILEKEYKEKETSIYLVQEMLPSALSKLTVIRDGGFRLCHKVIAERILTVLHAPDNPEATLADVTFKAAETYIQTMSCLYGSEDKYVNDILKELIIDRSYIDSEERKTKFSVLVETIPRWSDRERLLNLLIQRFPENPHYYNHLARLLATGDKKNRILPQYDKAEQMAREAIDRAVSGRNTHETTLGCIYGQWIIRDIQQEAKNRREGRLASDYEELITNFLVRYKEASDLFENARMEADVNDNFSYFPQIKMECEIIQNLIRYDPDRELGRLLKEEPRFQEWYDDHFSIANELYRMMRDQMGEDAQLLNDARSRLEQIAENPGAGISRQFAVLLDSDSPADRRRRRSLVYTVFSINGYTWKNTEPEILRLAEQCARRNLMAQDGSHSYPDVETWFELYRHLSTFQASEALAVIADYMQEGVRKSYLLFCLTFLLRKNSLSAASVADVVRLASETSRIARLQGLNTARERDAFLGAGAGMAGCPVVSATELPRNDARDPLYLEVFTGTVTDVEQTHGKILLDRLNLEASLVPSPQSAADDPARIFTREDIGCRVRLNIMFSYSGLRAWKPVKL